MVMHGPLRLFIKSPGQEERVYDMTDGSVTIGRDKSAEIPVEDRTLSRRHCRVYVGADGWRVTDLGSRNGTFLNGSPILDDRLEAGGHYDFRHAWNLNLSVDRELFERLDGPFAAGLRPYMYEDKCGSAP